MKRITAVLLLSLALCGTSLGGTPKIVYYGTLDAGLAEARRSGRPIMFVSAAPHCHGVSGIW
ncbi:MAG: hypothetical protein AAF497_25470 [Planctomycetota bacterium]